MALALHARRARENWKKAVRLQKDAVKTTARERDHRRQADANVQELETKVKSLEEKEAQLEKWQERKPYIQHYLDLLPRMARYDMTCFLTSIEIG